MEEVHYIQNMVGKNLKEIGLIINLKDVANFFLKMELIMKLFYKAHLITKMKILNKIYV